MPNGVINNRQSMESFRDELIKIMKRINERNETFLEEKRVLNTCCSDEYFAEFFTKMKNLEAQRELCQVCFDDLVQMLNAAINALLRIEQAERGR